MEAKSDRTGLEAGRKSDWLMKEKGDRQKGEEGKARKLAQMRQL